MRETAAVNVNGVAMTPVFAESPRRSRRMDAPVLDVVEARTGTQSGRTKSGRPIRVSLTPEAASHLAACRRRGVPVEAIVWSEETRAGIDTATIEAVAPLGRVGRQMRRMTPAQRREALKELGRR